MGCDILVRFSAQPPIENMQADDISSINQVAFTTPDYWPPWQLGVAISHCLAPKEARKRKNDEIIEVFCKKSIALAIVSFPHMIDATFYESNDTIVFTIQALDKLHI